MKVPKTRKPARLYRWLTWRRDLESAVGRLTNLQLRALDDYLVLAGARTGIPALIHGLIQHTAATRLLNPTDKDKDL